MITSAIGRKTSAARNCDKSQLEQNVCNRRFPLSVCENGLYDFETTRLGLMTKVRSNGNLEGAFLGVVLMVTVQIYPKKAPHVSVAFGIACDAR